MSSIIRATTTSGLQIAPDNSGSLILQTNGTTAAVTVDTSQNTTFAGKVTSAGALTLASNGTTTAVTIDTSQNVGIGTASPASKLHVNGNVAINTSANNSKLGIYVDSLSDFAIGYGANFDNYITAGASGSNIFRTSSTERMRIDSSGYVRVNNTSGIDAQFSSVAGSYYAGGFANTDATYPVTYNWNRATSGNNLFMTFYTDSPASSRGTIDYNRAGNAVRYNTTSDKRLKENIVDAPSATDLINSVKIRSFDWKETGFHVDYGVIAQELNEVAPDAVSEGIDNEDGTIKQSWGVDTSVLVPALIKAIQEQQTIINDLKARIETLEAK